MFGYVCTFRYVFRAGGQSKNLCMCVCVCLGGAWGGQAAWEGGGRGTEGKGYLHSWKQFLAWSATDAIFALGKPIVQVLRIETVAVSSTT